MNQRKSNKIRRSEFDWLRVLAFGILVFFHTGMLFVHWDWHIKNNELSTGIEWPMIFVGEWRMSLIFLISGVGVFYSLGYRSMKIFFKDRLTRIIIPLIAGIFLLVAPQVYFERLTEGYDRNYLEFYRSFLSFEPYPSGDFSWHHLWFLLYIFVYSLLFAPIFFWIKKSKLYIGRFKKWAVILIPVLWFGTGEFLLASLFPKTHALYNDWYAHFMYISIFLAGFFIAYSEDLQRQIKDCLKVTLVSASITVILLYSLFWIGNSGWDYIPTVIYHYLVAANRWLWIMVILGFSLQYLNVPSRNLTVVNQYVYPFYILHQTVIIVLGYYLRDVHWSILTKFTLITFSTFGICFIVIHFLIMRVNFLRVLFGMKPVT